MLTTQDLTFPRFIRIGPWMFDTEDGTLRGPEGDRKLEDRAARTLALLCARRGEILSQTTILESVWQGRQVSPNSVAVVVADLRRALKDDARDPVHIETIAKRGYRLKADEMPVAGGPAAMPRTLPWGRLRYLAAAAAVLAATTGSIAWLAGRHGDRQITVELVRNDTGTQAYSPLASAMSELLVNRISKFDGVDVYPRSETDGSAGLVVQSRLILWNGIPTLSMTGRDHGGHVVWSGMAMGPPSSLAGRTISELAGLRKAVR